MADQSDDRGLLEELQDFLAGEDELLRSLDDVLETLRADARAHAIDGPQREALWERIQARVAADA